MKKKVILPLAIALIVFLAVFIVILIHSSYVDEEPVTSFEKGEDLYAVKKENEDAAFSFLTKETPSLPDNMRGYVLDPEKDLDLSDSSEQALKNACQNVFNKVNAIYPNTVVILFKSSNDYTIDGFNYMKYLSDRAKAKNMSVVFSLSPNDYLVNKSKADAFLEKAREYGGDAFLIDFSVYEKDKDKVKSLSSELYDGGILLGLSLSGNKTENIKNSIENSEFPFYFLNIDTISDSETSKIISSYSESSLKSKSPLYAILRNDLVKPRSDGKSSEVISNIVKKLYNTGGFQGAVMRSRDKLSKDDNGTTVSLFSYYEGFNDIEYTALNITEFSVKDGKSVIFKGVSNADSPVFIKIPNGAWQKIKQSGEDGNFSAEIPLITGENKIILRHKNALYTYLIDKNADVMTSHSVKIEDGTAYFTASALRGSKVYASLANVIPVELSPENPASNENYITYTATYKLKGGLVDLNENLVSFGASFNGLNDIEIPGKSREPSPYTDNGKGKATMCLVTTDHAEVTPEANNDDKSDPLFTPQLKGSISRVKSYSVTDNHVNYITSSGMKVHFNDAKLIIGGYAMPDNNVSLKTATENDSTTLAFSLSCPVFTKQILYPQVYYKGRLERVYNVKELTAEYLDVMFYDSVSCSMSENFDFTNSPIISKIEWFQNSENKIINLRIYLKNKNVFNGYSFNYDESGNLILKLKYNKNTLPESVIIIDPGHGGYGSPGTYSVYKSVYEKDVNLAIAQKTASILNGMGAKVYITRQGDDAVTLAERTKYERELSPDLFVSIHCDGDTSEGQYGTHSFYYRNFSMPLASYIHNELVNAYRTYYYSDPDSEEYKKLDMGCNFFPYNVTRVEECPSVLVECGYLTNNNDARFLTDENGQNIIANAIANGIIKYVTEK